MILKLSRVPQYNRLLAVSSLLWTSQEASKTFEKESKIKLGGVSDEASFGKGFKIASDTHFGFKMIPQSTPKSLPKSLQKLSPCAPDSRRFLA